MTFLDMLSAAERQNNSMLCVGLDPEPTKFPDRIKGDSNKIYDFCAAIVDATADLAIAFKPQIAYFAAHRAEGQLERLMEHMVFFSGLVLLIVGVVGFIVSCVARSEDAEPEWLVHGATIISLILMGIPICRLVFFFLTN